MTRKKIVFTSDAPQLDFDEWIEPGYTRPHTVVGASSHTDTTDN